MKDKKIKRINRILRSIERDLPEHNAEHGYFNSAKDGEFEDLDKSLYKLKSIKNKLYDAEDIEKINKKIKILSKLVLRYA